MTAAKLSAEQAAIVTVTFNPSIDISGEVDVVLPDVKLRCADARYEPGGGGVNVARAIRELGGVAKAFVITGGATGRWLADMLAKEGIEFISSDIDGITRPSLSILEKSSGSLYRFQVPGPRLTEHCADAVETTLYATIEKMTGGYLVVSGSLPPGLPSHLLQSVSSRCRAAGVRLVVDTSGPALVSLMGAGAYLIKPNVEELEQLRLAVGWAKTSIEETARALISNGTAEVVAVTLGAEGAALISRDLENRTPALPVEKVSEVGAGDSFLAGMVRGLALGLPFAEAFRHAMAAGAAALLTPGTGLVRKLDFDRLLALDVASRPAAPSRGLPP